jgi:hypothetical protein
MPIGAECIIAVNNTAWLRIDKIFMNLKKLNRLVLLQLSAYQETITLVNANFMQLQLGHRSL